MNIGEILESTRLDDVQDKICDNTFCADCGLAYLKAKG